MLNIEKCKKTESVNSSNIEMVKVKIYCECGYNRFLTLYNTKKEKREEINKKECVGECPNCKSRKMSLIVDSE